MTLSITAPLQLRKSTLTFSGPNSKQPILQTAVEGSEGKPLAQGHTVS